MGVADYLLGSKLLVASKLPRKDPAILRQALGAIAWGIFFSVAPYDGWLLPAAIVWIPLLVWRERQRAKRHGFFPGAVVRALVVAFVVGAAAVAPLEYLDRRVPVLGASRATLREVDSLHALQTGRPYPRLFATLEDSVVATTTVRLPSESMRRREFLSFLGAQLGRRPRVAYEGGFTSVAFGAHPLWILWRDTSRR